MSEKKYRLNTDFKTEKDKQFLYAVANICGLRKQPTDIDLYIRSLIDYRDILETLYTPPSEPELEVDLNEVDKDLTEALNSFLQTFEKLASFLRSVFSKIRKISIRSGKNDKT
jgi:hypothetical protein